MISKLIKFEVKPESCAAFKAALAVNNTGAETELDCVEMKAFVDNKMPNVFFLLGRWQTQEGFETHIAQPYAQAVAQLVKTALLSAPEMFSLSETTPATTAAKSANLEDEVFIIFFIFKHKQEMRQRLIERFETHINHTRQEEGCLLFDLYTIDGVEDSLVVYEHWRNESAVWDIHFKQPYSEITGALMHEAVIGDLEQYMNFVTEIS